MFEPGMLIDGKYKILNEIGHGGMSIVYLAINEKANKTWAVKVVRKDAKIDFDIVQQGLITEINTLKKIKHPKLPSIVDVIEDDDKIIVVMDYIEGRSLDKIVLEEGPQREKNVVEWAKQLCEVIGFLHNQDPPIIYRDMKPGNIMLKPDGSIMIIDFGTVKKYDFEEGVTQGLGTYGYAPPEHFLGSHQRSDRRSDIYSLGMTLYTLLTGIDPGKQVVGEASVRKINPMLSTGINDIILKCTARNPEDRYQRCEELLFDLNNIEKVDRTYRKKAKMKIVSFFTASALALVFACTGLTFSVIADRKATDVYSKLIEEAKITADNDERIKLYLDAINVPDKSGNEQAYLGLIQTYKENDSVFTVKEAEQIEGLIKTNQAALIENKDGYVEVCFELGKLFWYYYEYGDGENNQITRAKSSVEWFQYVVDNAENGYENINMAKVYSNIGAFYRDITMNITEASDKGKYKPFFSSLEELMRSVAHNSSESEIVRLELIETARSAIHQYSTKFKIDGVTEEQLTKLYNEIEICLDEIEVSDDEDDIRAVKKEYTRSRLEDTLNAMKLAYSTTKDGN